MPQPDSPRFLILGTAKGYRWEQVEPFLMSWRATCPHASLVLLIDETSSPEFRKRLEDSGAGYFLLPRLWTERSRLIRRILLSFHAAPLHRWLANRIGDPLKAAPNDILKWRRLAAEFHHIGCSRFFSYLAYLEAHSQEFSHVLLTDVRDVIFQADPFAHAPAAGLVLALETQGATLLAQTTNSRWLDYAYGRGRWMAFGDRRVSCAGTTLGTAPAIREYLTRMSAEIIRLTPRLVGQDGLDQGVHNFLLNMGQLPPSRLSENGHGTFATLHGEDPARFRRDDRLRLINDDGSVIPVVHQFDRHPVLTADLIRSLSDQLPRAVGD